MSITYRGDPRLRDNYSAAIPPNHSTSLFIKDLPSDITVVQTPSLERTTQRPSRPTKAHRSSSRVFRPIQQFPRLWRKSATPARFLPSMSIRPHLPTTAHREDFLIFTWQFRCRTPCDSLRSKSPS